MKAIFSLLFTLVLATTTLFGGTTEPLVDSLLVTNAEAAGHLPLMLAEGMTFEAAGTRLHIRDIDEQRNGTGDLYFPALDESFRAVFSNLQVNALGEVLSGEIRARSQVQGEVFGAVKDNLYASIMGPNEGEKALTLPLNITPHLRSRQNFLLPEDGELSLTEVTVNTTGAFVGLALNAGTLVEGDRLDFSATSVSVDPLTFCLEDASLAIANGGGKIDDYEFPMKILAGDPDEEEAGSYATFTCDGFKEFNLSAQYAFPVDQVKAVAEGKDTVYASFRINAVGLKSFVAFATVTPFTIVGVDDMKFRIDSAYVDYSDTKNPVGLVDPVTNKAPKEDWRGMFLRRLSITLPEAVSSFNGGKEMSIAGENIMYAKGKGMSGTLAAYNLLDLSKGGLNGWGFSIDTLQAKLVQNSVGGFDFNGKVFIPVFGEKDKIGYKCFLEKKKDKTSLTLGLDIVGKYTVPFLGDASMELTKNSKAGVRYGSDGFEPYMTVSGSIKVQLSTSKLGSGVPDVDLPEIKFQDFKLNDLKLAAKKGMARAKEGLKEGKKQVTAGLDKMSFGSFKWGGYDKSSTPADTTSTTSSDTTAVKVAEGKSMNGKKFNLKKISFKSDTTSKEGVKRLIFQAQVNLTKGKGGIAGELDLAILGKVEFGKLISTTPWKAISYHKTEVGSLGIQARFGIFEMAGVLNMYDQHPIYGKGFKGGLELKFKLGKGPLTISTMGQFGTAPGPKKNQYDYFFVDMRVDLPKGIPLGSVEITSLGGGLYYNMTKSLSTKQSEKVGTSKLNTTPGESFSGALYKPRRYTLGFSVATTVSMPQKKDVFIADLELSIELGLKNFGVRKILLNGDGFFMLKDPDKRDEAVLKARLAIELNFVQGFMSANFAYAVRSPYKDPVLTGGGLDGKPQGALMIDLYPNDTNDHSNYFYFGKPKDPATLSFKLAGASLNIDGYVMLGADLPPPLKLAEIHKAFAKFKDITRTKGKNMGFAFGIKMSTKGDFTAGPLSVYWDLLLGLDASIIRYQGTTCANTGSTIGMNGFYIKGRAYAYIDSRVKLRVSLGWGKFKIKKTVRLIDFQIAASLIAELPNPTYIAGDLHVRASAYGVKVNKRLSFSLGEQCKTVFDASEVVSDVSSVAGSLPDKNSDEAKSFNVFEDIVVSFKKPMDYNPAGPYAGTNTIEALSDNNLKVEYYAHLDYIKVTGGGGEVAFTEKWDDKHQLVRLVTRDALRPQTDYTLAVKMAWRIKVGKNGSWNNLRDKNKKIVTEDYEVKFRTGDFPRVIAVKTLDADRHYPGRGQRNWHRNFAPGEVYFKKGGMDDVFATRMKKTIAGKGEKMMNVRYAIKLTDLENNEVKEIPITERPGSFQVEESTTERRSITVPTSTNGDSRNINYSVTKLVKRNSRGIKFNGINAVGILEKDHMYRCEIMRIPIPDEAAKNKIASEKRTVEEVSAGIDGIKINKVKTTITGGNTDPFLQPETVYGFVFRTSKYDNLQQKVERMQFVSRKTGNAARGIDDPAVLNVSDKDIAGYPSKMKMPAVDDAYYSYSIDEGFDWWERERLKVNLRMDESSVSGYYGSSQGRALKAGAEAASRIDRLPPVWKAAFRTDLQQDKDDVWAETIFPGGSTDRTRQEPKLTQGEISAGKANSTVNFATGGGRSGSYLPSGKWDLALVHKGRRVLAFQASAVTMIARTFYANAPYYRSSYDRNSGWSASWSQGIKYVKYSVENVQELNRMGDGRSKFDEMKRKADDGYSSSGAQGIVLGGTARAAGKQLGWCKKRIKIWSPWKDYYKTISYPCYSSWDKTFSYSRFQYTWRKKLNYTLPSDDQVDILNRTMNSHGPEIRNVSSYSAPLKYYYKDTYSTLSDRVESGGQSVSRQIDNILQK